MHRYFTLPKVPSPSPPLSPRYSKPSLVQCAAQCSAVQCSAVQYSAVKYSAVQCSAVCWYVLECTGVQYCRTEYSRVQYSTVQCCKSTVQCSTAINLRVDMQVFSYTSNFHQSATINNGYTRRIDMQNCYWSILDLYESTNPPV